MAATPAAVRDRGYPAGAGRQSYESSSGNAWLSRPGFASNCYHPYMTSTPPAAKHRSLAMRRRRWTAWITLPFAIVLLIAGIASALIAYSNFEGRFGIAVAGLALFGALCVAIPVGRSSWIALTDKEPVLIVDSTGITDHFHLNAFLPWSDIKSVSLEYGDGNSLSIVLRDGARGSGGKPVEPSIARTLKIPTSSAICSRTTRKRARAHRPSAALTVATM
jgi:hypothetical protein